MLPLDSQASTPVISIWHFATSSCTRLQIGDVMFFFVQKIPICMLTETLCPVVRAMRVRRSWHRCTRIARRETFVRDNAGVVNERRHESGPTCVVIFIRAPIIGNTFQKNLNFLAHDCGRFVPAISSCVFRTAGATGFHTGHINLSKCYDQSEGGSNK